MKNRVILHIDMDYFFAQIEERENPQFKGKPVVVGADPKGGRGRGVVSTCNYLARKYGVYSALPISKAYQLCPNAIFLPVNMELYQKVSENIMEIIKKYSPVFEQVSLDEAYLDLSHIFYDRRKCGIEMVWEEAKKIAKKLKEEIFEKEKLTATVGIGLNKLIAKMATNKAKPNGLLIIKPNQVKKFLEPLDIEDLPGVGPKTAEKLRNLKDILSSTDQSAGLKVITTIGDLKKLKQKTLVELFGKWGKAIYQRARGLDEEEVSSGKVVKSIGKEHTFEKDTRDSEIIFNTFDKIIKNVWQELIENEFSFKTITVICRFSGFETHTKSKTLKEATKDFEILRRESKKLLLKFLVENPKLIRLIGLRISIV